MTVHADADRGLRILAELLEEAAASEKAKRPGPTPERLEEVRRVRGEASTG